MNHTLKNIWNVVTWAMVAVFALGAFALVGVRALGLTPYAVLSGSMEPTYPVGSLLYVKSGTPEEVQVGDPITFLFDAGSGTVATHRVISIDSQARTFQTQGDANLTPDGAPVPFDRLIGKPVLAIPQLGVFSQWISTPPGLYAGVTAGAVILILALMPGLLDKADAADRKKRADSGGH